MIIIDYYVVIYARIKLYSLSYDASLGEVSLHNEPIAAHSEIKFRAAAEYCPDGAHERSSQTP